MVAVDDPLQGAAARNRIPLCLRRNARQRHVVVVLQSREVLIAAPNLRETHLALADPVALPRVRRRVQARLLLHRRIRLHPLVVHVQVRQLASHAHVRVETRRTRNVRQHLLQIILVALPILRVMQQRVHVEENVLLRDPRIPVVLPVRGQRCVRDVIDAAIPVQDHRNLLADRPREIQGRGRGRPIRPALRGGRQVCEQVGLAPGRGGERLPREQGKHLCRRNSTQIGKKIY